MIEIIFTAFILLVIFYSIHLARVEDKEREYQNKIGDRLKENREFREIKIRRDRIMVK